MESLGKIWFYIIDAFPNVAAVLIGAIIITYYLPKRSLYWFRVAASFVLIGIWVYFGKLLTPSGQFLNIPIAISTFAGLFLFTALSVMIWSRASWYQALFATTVSYSLQNLCERIIEIPLIYWGWFPRQLIIPLFALSFVILRRLMNKYQRKQTVLDFSNADNRILLFISTGVVVVCVVLDVALRNEVMAFGPNGKAYICIIMAMFSFLSILVSVSHLRETDAEKRMEQTAQLLRVEQRRYEYDKQIHEAINLKCHDIRHQIAAIRSRTEDDAYRAELKKIGKLVDIYDAEPHSQNPALDVVLAGKMLTCNSLGINITCMADGRRLDFMEDCDVYALFGNILDNAIEAVRQVEDPELHVIALTVDTKDDFLIIECENYFSGKLVFDDGLPLTTKSDSQNHGFGTHSIRTLSEKYDGTFKLSVQDDIFTLSILIPIPA